MNYCDDVNDHARALGRSETVLFYLVLLSLVVLQGHGKLLLSKFVLNNGPKQLNSVFGIPNVAIINIKPCKSFFQLEIHYMFGIQAMDFFPFFVESDFMKT